VLLLLWGLEAVAELVGSVLTVAAGSGSAETGSVLALLVGIEVDNVWLLLLLLVLVVASDEEDVRVLRFESELDELLRLRYLKLEIFFLNSHGQ